MAALGTAVSAADGSSAAQEHEFRVLYEIIHTVNSTLDLEQVLGAIVRLVNDAIVAHATYIFLSEDRGRRIVLRAASEHYAHLSGRVSMAAGEGIAGWVLQNGSPYSSRRRRSPTRASSTSPSSRRRSTSRSCRSR